VLGDNQFLRLHEAQLESDDRMLAQVRGPGALLIKKHRVVGRDVREVRADVAGLYGGGHLSEQIADRGEGHVPLGVFIGADRRRAEKQRRDDRPHTHHAQNSAWRGARGNGITSRMFFIPVQN
jgi:hypothetical protein